MCSRFCQSLVCTLKPVPLVKGVACAVAGRTLISSVCAMLRLRPRSRQFVTGKSVLWTSLLTLSLTSKKIVWTTISSEPPLYFGLKDTDSASGQSGQAMAESRGVGGAGSEVPNQPRCGSRSSCPHVVDSRRARVAISQPPESRHGCED